MSTNFAKTLVWKHEYDVKLWRHKQRSPNKSDHHMSMNEILPMKIFCVRHWTWPNVSWNTHRRFHRNPHRYNSWVLLEQIAAWKTLLSINVTRWNPNSLITIFSQPIKFILHTLTHINLPNTALTCWHRRLFASMQLSCTGIACVDSSGEQHFSKKFWVCNNLPL